MKLAKPIFLALSLATITSSAIVSAQGFVIESAYPTYFAEMRQMMAKMNASDKQKAMEMEAAILKMERDHQMAMTKATMEHKMAILKMRREYEDFTYSRVGGQ